MKPLSVLVAIVALAIPASAVAGVTAESRLVRTGSKAKITFSSAHDDTATVVIGYFTEDSASFQLGAGPPVERESEPVEDADVGRVYRGQMASFTPNPYAAQDEVASEVIEDKKKKLEELLVARKGKVAALRLVAATVRDADDAALAELEKGRAAAAAIIEAGATGAEAAADKAVSDGWSAAATIWKDAEEALSAWALARAEIRDIDNDLNDTLGLAPWPEDGKEKEDTPSATAAAIRFILPEFVTYVGGEVSPLALFVRPAGFWDEVQLKSIAPGVVEVSRGEAGFIEVEKETEKIAVGAEVGQVRFTGFVASGSVGDVSVDVHADREPDPAHSIPGTSVAFAFDKLLRRPPDADKPGRTSFAYDDPRSKGPKNSLMIYVSGRLEPAVDRYGAFAFLRNATQFTASELDDSHAGAKKLRVGVHWRHLFDPDDPNVGTIEFAERRKFPGTDNLLFSDYTGESGGRFTFAFAYKGLPALNSDFGDKKIEMRTLLAGGGEAVVGVQDFKAFFNMAKGNHPVGNWLPIEVQKLAKDAPNYLYYYSADARGTGVAAVPYLFFYDEISSAAEEKMKPITIRYDYNLHKMPGTLAVTGGHDPGNKQLYGWFTTTFYHPAIMTLLRKAASGQEYTFSETKDIQIFDPAAPGSRRTARRTLSVEVRKPFVALIAHTLRHERRHIEQMEDQARLPGGDPHNNDKDRVHNLQENANNTSAFVETTWPLYPISNPNQAKGAFKNIHGDDEVDCELAALPFIGVPASDWGVVFYEGDSKGKGSNWNE